MPTYDDYYGDLQRGIGRGIAGVGNFFGDAFKNEFSDFTTPAIQSGQARALFPGNPGHPEGYDQAEIAKIGKEVAERAGTSTKGQDHDLTTGLTGGRAFGDSGVPYRQGYDPSVKESQSYIRYQTPGGEWQDYSHDDSDNRANSEQDWSKVANPSAFQGYREMPADYEDAASIRRSQALINDPFALENERTNNALQLYQGQKRIDRGIEEDRQHDYMGAMGGIESERNQRLQMLRNSPDYQALGPQERAAVEDQLNSVFDKKAELHRGGQQFGERFSPKF